MSTKRPLSGTQLILSSLRSDAFPQGAANPSHFHVTFAENEPHACALCGGMLTEERYPVSETLSSKWFTSQELEAKDEEMLCAGCKWFFAGKMTRQTFLNLHHFNIFTGEDTLVLDANGFYHFLKNGFQYPCIIAVLDESSRTRKHVVWKLNRSISYSDSDVQVSFLSIETENGCYDGTARFSASAFLPIVDKFCEVAKLYRESTASKYKNLWAQYYGCLRRLHSEFKSKGYSSENLYFAMYLACNMIFPIDERVEERQKAKGAKK